MSADTEVVVMHPDYMFKISQFIKDYYESEEKMRSVSLLRQPVPSEIFFFLFPWNCKLVLSAADAVRIVKHSIMSDWKWVTAAIFFSPIIEIKS